MREAIYILVYGAGTVYKGEVIVLKLEGPTSQSDIRILHLLEPAKRRVIGYYGEVSAIKEQAKLHDGQKHRKALSFSDNIFPFCIREGLAEAGNWVVDLIFVQLGQNGSDSDINSISKEYKGLVEVGVNQYWRQG